MTSHHLFPERIETERLVFERFGHDTVDPFEFYAFVSSDGWREDATDHMPWFRFQRLDEVLDFIDAAEGHWDDGESARYLLRSRAGDEMLGVTAYSPEWEARRAGSDIVLAPEHWGQEFGLERASAFIELTFEQYDLEAYYTTCAAGNEPSRRMIQKYVGRYGGRHEGLLRQHSPRPDGEVTAQHRFTILREEYVEATADRRTMQFDVEW